MVLINVKEDPVTESDMARIKSIFLQTLYRNGIVDNVTIKVKDLSRHPQRYLRNAVALYRSTSQFRSRPTFWLNSNPAPYDEIIQDDLEMLGHTVTTSQRMILDSLYHEYGHVISEYIKYENPELWRKILQDYTDEEDFCEHGVLPYLDNNLLTNAEHNRLADIVKWYAKDAELEPPAKNTPKVSYYVNKSSSKSVSAGTPGLGSTR